MHCEELNERITDYLEDVLDIGERERLEKHLVDCSSCATFVEQMKTTIKVVGQQADDGVPTDRRDSLRKMFLDWKSRRS